MAARDRLREWWKRVTFVYPRGVDIIDLTPPEPHDVAPPFILGPTWCEAHQSHAHACADHHREDS